MKHNVGKAAVMLDAERVAVPVEFTGRSGFQNQAASLAGKIRIKVDDGARNGIGDAPWLAVRAGNDGEDIAHPVVRTADPSGVIIG